MRKVPVGDDLKRRAAELGVIEYVDDSSESRAGVYSALRAVVSEAELQRRVIAAETLLTTQRSWMLAAISAIAAAASAAAAILAVIFGRSC